MKYYELRSWMMVTQNGSRIILPDDIRACLNKIKIRMNEIDTLEELLKRCKENLIKDAEKIQERYEQHDKS